MIQLGFIWAETLFGPHGIHPRHSCTIMLDRFHCTEAARNNAPNELRFGRYPHQPRRSQPFRFEMRLTSNMHSKCIFRMIRSPWLRVAPSVTFLPLTLTGWSYSGYHGNNRAYGVHSGWKSSSGHHAQWWHVANQKFLGVSIGNKKSESWVPYCKIYFWILQTN